MEWELLSYVKASRHRKDIMHNLADEKVKTPKEISGDLDIHLSQTSKSLGELQDKNLVECMTPEKRKGKLFRLTDEGKDIVDHL